MSKERHKPKFDRRHENRSNNPQQTNLKTLTKQPANLTGAGGTSRFGYLGGNGADVPAPTLRQRLHRIYPEEKSPFPDGSGAQHEIRNLLNGRS